MIKTTRFNLPIVKRKRTKGTLILISITIILFLFLVISHVLDENNEPPFFRTMIIGIIMILSVFVYIFRSYKVEEFERIGNVLISVNSLEITLDEKTLIYTIADLKQLRVK